MYTVDNEEFAEGIRIIEELLDLNLAHTGIQIKAVMGQSNAFLKYPDSLEIKYAEKHSFYRMFLMGIQSGLPCYEENTGSVRHLTYMLDCSRNAVINVVSAKRLLVHLCVLGYQELSLYTEDTYEVQEEPCFGYLRGRFSPEEIHEIVSFADIFGMTVTLSIQCLAHMRSIYRYETYYKEAFDCNDVLMVGSKRVEILLDRMFASIAAVLPSKTVNIGMDEPFMLGRGKYLNKNGYTAPGKLFLEQLKTVVRIAERYGFRLKMWGDCVDSGYENREEIVSFAREHGIKIIFWNYGSASEGEKTVEKVSYDMRSSYLKERKESYPNCCFCISDYKFFGLAPHNNLALHIAKGYVDAAIHCGIDELWLASWGDCGAETSPFAALPVMAYVGYAAAYEKEIGTFEDWFCCLFGSLEAFLMLDYANCLAPELNMKCNTSSKYFLYQDAFMGVMDRSVRKEYADYYALHTEKLCRAKEQVSRQYRYLFDTQIKLLEVLRVKHVLGIQTRETFSSGKKEEVSALIPIYQELLGRLRDFFAAFRVQWYRDHKVFGFEIQEARIGALLFRIENCRERLAQYCRGEIEEIPELKEEILDLYGNGDDIIMLNWGELISAGVMIEYFSFV